MERLTQARAALAAGKWADVTEHLDADDLTAPELEVLAEARWWTGDPHGAIDAWQQAHRAAVDDGRRTDAVQLASWIALEYASLGAAEAASGWTSRAKRFVPVEDPSLGWHDLATAATSGDPDEQCRLSERALTRARAGGDHDLEIRALARQGLARIRAGDAGDGLACFDEALAAATAGEAERLRTIGEVCCELVLATELTGDVQRFARWMDVVTDFVERRGFPSVVGFCSTCCAEVEVVRGDFASAEQQLRAAVVSLHEAGHAARCVPPAAKLAELLVLQGRVEEAEQLLDDDDSGESLLAHARIALARGDAPAAAVAAGRAARRLGGDPLVRISAGAVLVDARLAAGDVDEAGRAADRLERQAATSDHRRGRAVALVAAGRVAVARGDREQAERCFEQALDEVAGVQGSLEGADAHLELARLQRDEHPSVARTEARAARRAYESVGARHRADEAAALLRELGDRSRVGDKGLELLTQREREVLQLVGQGLTNAEIAERLFISTKTAGNHVSSILSKLQLRSRVEAATYATLHPEPAG